MNTNTPDIVLDRAKSARLEAVDLKYREIFEKTINKTKSINRLVIFNCIVFALIGFYKLDKVHKTDKQELVADVARLSLVKKEETSKMSKLLMEKNKQEVELYNQNQEYQKLERSFKALEERNKKLSEVKLKPIVVKKQVFVKPMKVTRKVIKTKVGKKVVTKNKSFVPCNANGDHVIESNDSRICLNLITGNSIVERK